MDGRYNSPEAPDEQIMHITPGYSRDHWPDLNHVMLEWIVEQHAGIPLLMKLLSGNTNDQGELGLISTEQGPQLRTAHRSPTWSPIVPSYTAENLGHLAQSGRQWIPRGPATLAEVHTVLARVTPETMPPFSARYGSRSGLDLRGEQPAVGRRVFQARQQRSRQHRGPTVPHPKRDRTAGL